MDLKESFMFANLTSKLTSVFAKLRGKGTLSQNDVELALREIRISLLEADVALSVVKELIESIKEKAIGAEVLSSLNPAHLVVKIVQDHLIEVLGSDSGDLKLQGKYPATILMLGLQGSGKTTTTAKLAKRLKEKEGRKVLLVSLDIYRPAAQEQLEILAKSIGVDSLEIIQNQTPAQIAKRGMSEGRVYDVVLFDTAGRLQIDDALMNELVEIEKIISPSESLLVADSLTGQDAVNVAKGFMEKVALTGVILTRVDGDAKGGAALSMRAVTKCPIKFMGLGEKVDALEVFHPKRIAERILDMGDIVSLVEKTLENFDMKNAEAMAKKMQDGGMLDLSDFAVQLEQMVKMGGFSTIMSHLPGMEQMKSQIPSNLMDDKVLTRMLAIIRSMTKEERANSGILNASRKRRIAKGSGTQVQDVNRLLKMHQEMGAATKKFGKLAKLGKLGKLNFLKNGLTGFNPGRLK